MVSKGLKSMRISFRSSFQFESHFQNEEKKPIIDYFLKKILRKEQQVIGRKCSLNVSTQNQYVWKLLIQWCYSQETHIVNEMKMEEHDRVTIQLIHFCDIYRKVVISSRGYYQFQMLPAAASIWGRLLIKGGYYYKVPQKLREIAPKTDNICTFYLTYELK